MKKFLIIFCVAALPILASGNFLYKITDGKFRPVKFDNPRSMVAGEHYTLLVNGTAIVKYNYKTGATVDTLFSVYATKKCPFKKISGYELSPNEQKLMVYNEVSYRYRRTFLANYYVYDLKRKELEPLSDLGAQQVPLFSPDSRYIAFARGGNLFLKKLEFHTEIAITKDGEEGKIQNGTPDWVYEEEFEATRHFAWSTDSKLLAFTKFNETEVPEFSFQTFLNNNNELLAYPQFVHFKYPRAGENNSKVSVCVYDDFNKTTRVMKIAEPDEDYYVPRIKWTNMPNQLAIFKLNRNQNRLDMIFADPRSTISKLILREESKQYVGYENIDYIQFTSDNQYFFGVSETDNYRHLYQYRITGQIYKQLTKGKWDLTDFYGYDEAKKLLYYQSAEVSPLQRQVYALDSKGKKLALTTSKGTHAATFNSTFSLFTDNASSLTQPNKLTLCTNTGAVLRTIANNDALLKSLDTLAIKSFFSFQTSENIVLNGWMLKPADFDASKKYPVLQVQYSGPNSQQVLDKWNVNWEYYLASKGYVIVCVDGRGTGARGTAFRHCTYQQLGKLEAADQIETARYLAKQSYIDKDRIGIWGSSYGGYMTLMSMSSGEPIFKAGIAVAPVTDWKLYNTAYTERFMRRPQENFDGYKQASALEVASKLNGTLLLVHGTADDNVHLQNTLLYIDKLVKANKQVEIQLYTDKNHSILGEQTRRHLYTRMSEFLFQNL
ncbi:MAG: S9 family peptidase [Porphyromonadaceae bacterium CG2_30_38_12]|nr:MAG: S9 family peptidase [Porphyromonadaceae bacterium CG2_30_38_12]